MTLTTPINKPGTQWKMLENPPSSMVYVLPLAPLPLQLAVHLKSLLDAPLLLKPLPLFLAKCTKFVLLTWTPMIFMMNCLPLKHFVRGDLLRAQKRSRFQNISKLQAMRKLMTPAMMVTFMYTWPRTTTSQPQQGSHYLPMSTDFFPSKEKRALLNASWGLIFGEQC